METERLKSEFNDAIGFLNRCNQLFYLIDTFSASLDIFNWFHHLRVLYKELSADMDKPEQDKYRERFKELNTKVSRTIKNNNNQIQPQVIDDLDSIEIDLRKLFNDCGYQKKEEQDATKALR